VPALEVVSKLVSFLILQHLLIIRVNYRLINLPVFSSVFCGCLGAGWEFKKKKKEKEGKILIQTTIHRFISRFQILTFFPVSFSSLLAFFFSAAFSFFFSATRLRKV